MAYDPSDPNQVDPDYIDSQQTTRYLDKYQYTSMLDVQKALIGYGLDLQDPFNSANGKVNYTGGVKLINQSIYTILSTREGERFFMPAFGSRLYKLVFQPSTQVLYDLISSEVQRSLSQWEPRISVTSVNCSQNEANENQVDVLITYQLVNTSMAASYVYPLNKELYNMESGLSGLRENVVDNQGSLSSTDPLVN